MSNPDTTHKEYDDLAPTWKACRDASKGQRAIHAGGKDYLDKLSGQTDAEYEAYKKRAQFYNATGRTVDGMTGMVFRKQPKHEVPTGMEAWLNNINLAGKSLGGFAKDCVNETIKLGHGGILVDAPPAPESEDPLTIAEAELISLRPYMTLYKAEDILYWEFGQVRNVTVLTTVTLSEKYINADGEEDAQIRELVLAGGRYIQIIWRKASEQWVIHDTIIPTKGGESLTEIPFYFLAEREPGTELQDPPIEDLVNVNISHYKNSADLENGAHVAGQPTPYATGVPEDSEALHIGSRTAWMLPDAESQVGFLQCGSEGFASLEKLMDRKEQQMAALGARLIAPEKKAAETAETASIRRGGESSVLSSLAESVERQIEAALGYMAEWAGLDGDVRFELNKDYIVASMDAQMFTAWVSAWQSGAISDETFYEGLQSGELVAETLGFDDEQERKGDSAGALGELNDDSK